MKFDITVGDSHKAQVTVDLDGKGNFTGAIVSPEFGAGAISHGKQVGAALTGTVTLDGHAAQFSASLVGTAITGTLRVGWFFSEDFTGSEAA